jgi:hypothetical protein
MASRLLASAGEGEDRCWLYVDNHLRPYTGQHVIRKGWRMQEKRAVPGVPDYYVHDEDGCPLFRLSTASHDSICAWLMPVVERQRELMALRATVPRVAKVSETPLAGKLRRHQLGYKNVLDTLRTALANLESDFALLLAKRLERPREAKLLAALFVAPGTVHVGSGRVTVRLMPAANDGERAALSAFLTKVTRLRLELPGDPDHHRLRWMLK